MNHRVLPLATAGLLLACPCIGLCAENTPKQAPGKTQQQAYAEQVPKGLSAPDWSGIGAARENWRHAVVREADGMLGASNPGQRWRTRFDGRGFTVTPGAGGWSWGLELLRYGFPGSERAVATKATVGHEGGNVHYEWDAVLREWFINDGRGLQQGWTLEERPAGAREDEPLRLEFAVRGGLRPAVGPGGVGVSFLDAGGARVVDFGGLRAWDADGRALVARFEASDGGAGVLRVEVNESGARYPINVDPVAQQVYLKASNTGAGDSFGRSVAVSGDTVVVGASGEDSDTTGVNGDGTTNGAIDAGAAYVFVREGTNWSQQAYLKASNTGAGDYFGYSVAIFGDTVVVGAYGEDSGATGINGNAADNSASVSGAAYVFVREGTNWSQQAYLKASNTDTGDSFGYSVAILGDTVVVGASGEDSGATGINGNAADNSAGDSGAAYVFVRGGTNWSQQAYLKASNTGAGDSFGYSVAVSGDAVVIGAPWEDSGAMGVNGDGTNNGTLSAGAAYVFVREGTNWSQRAYLKASNTGASDLFGYSVAASGDTAVIGAYYEDSNATGINGNQSNNSLGDSGAAYVFVGEGTNWSQQAYLKASNTGAGDSFGYSVAVSGDTAMVGAYLEDSGTVGVNGDGADNSRGNSGAAYVFAREGTNWSQQAYLKASNTGVGDYFGVFVAVSGDTAVVGAYGEDSGATGINGNQADNGTGDSGAAYVFHAPSPQQEIVVEQPTGAEVLDGGTRTSFGAPPGGDMSLTFTIRNIGESNLTGLVITKDGADASDFTVTSSPVAPIAPGSNTTFVIQFAPTSAGAKTAAIHIANNDADENPFDITLTGRGHSTADDTDGDGLNDVAEFKLTALGFDWRVNNGSLVTPYFDAASSAGLYTESDFRNLYVGAPMVGVSNGTVTVELQLQKSDDLKNWAPFGDPVQWTEPGSGKCFYRLFFDGGTQP
ncbi:MAG TPA: choice-of-anchor D domain-containing protein [Verrucomicrobiae bacterium]|nr:choice-of-anchor D domain-containing protein [Verrucomicrobiae bacterium]